MAWIAGQVRARWPRVNILLRADSGFAHDGLMAWCVGNRVDYVFGLARDERLVGAIADDLVAAESLASGAPARCFADFAWLEPHAARRRQGRAPPQGANPRFRRDLARCR